jgi:putative transposase
MKIVLNKCPARLREAFKTLLGKVMYAESLQEARDQFKALKRDMGGDGQRAVSCIEKDLESLLIHYTFDKSYWRTLKTTNPIERINKELGVPQKKWTLFLDGFVDLYFILHRT